MAVSGVSSSTAPYLSPQNNVLQQFAQLATAIKSGNMTGAQQAYGQLTQSLGTSNTSSTSNSNSPFAQGLNAIGQALQSGNIADAQQALTSLQQAQGGHGHHGHHGDHGGTGAAGASSGGTSPAPNTSGGPAGNSVDLTV